MQKIAEVAHDLQVSLGRTSIPDFDELQHVGMAAILATHMRGLGAIDYSILKKVSEHFFDIPSILLRPVIELLGEIEYIDLVVSGNTINKVIPKIPHFESIYDGLGQYLNITNINEHEELSCKILIELRDKAEKKDVIFSKLGAEKNLFNDSQRIITHGGLVLSKRARGHDILVSPTYFSDNLDGLIDIAASGNSPRIEKIINLLKEAQGWPLSIVIKNKEINGFRLDDFDIQLLRKLIADGILKPPSINSPIHGNQHFIFTPRPGKVKLNAAKREIYERGMALVAAVRKGQLLPTQYAIKSPVALLRSFLNNGFIGSNSEAADQYRALSVLRVGKLVPVGRRHRFELIPTRENIEAVNIAIDLVESGALTGGALQEDAQIALQQDEQYIHSLIASTDYRKIEKIELDEETLGEYEQILLDLK